MSQQRILVELRDLKRYIQRKANHVAFDALIEKVSEQFSLVSPAHLDELNESVSTLQSTIERNARMAQESEKKAAAEFSKAMKAEKEVSDLLRKELMLIVGSALDGKMDLSLISRDFKTVKLSADLAKLSSAYFESALSIGMKNGQNGEIHIDANSVVLRLLGSYILLGPDLLDLVEIKQLDTRTTFDLMELSTQMLIPWLCSHLAANIDCCTFDVEMLKKASLQRDTCSSEFRDSWGIVISKAAQAIALDVKKYSITPEFGTIPGSVLTNVINLVDREPWPQLTDNTIYQGSDSASEVRKISTNGFISTQRSANRQMEFSLRLYDDNLMAMDGLTGHNSPNSPRIGICRFERYAPAIPASESPPAPSPRLGKVGSPFVILPAHSFERQRHSAALTSAKRPSGHPWRACTDSATRSPTTLPQRSRPRDRATQAPTASCLTPCATSTAWEAPTGRRSAHSSANTPHWPSRTWRRARPCSACRAPSSRAS